MRQGHTPAGRMYTIYSDGTGGVRRSGAASFDAWEIDCTRDALTDRRECQITDFDSRLLVPFNGASPRWVCIIGHDFPGRRGAIRVDRNPPVRTDEDGCVSGSFASALARGSEATARRVEWPYDYDQDETAPIAGFGEAPALAQHIRANVDRMAFRARITHEERPRN